MNIKLVFDDWQATKIVIDEHGSGARLRDYEKIEKLSRGVFHDGSIFTATIELTPDQEAELTRAVLSGASPVFYIPGYSSEKEKASHGVKTL